MGGGSHGAASWSAGRGNPNGGDGARGVSADGSVVVGTSEFSNGVEGYVWSEQTGQAVGIGDLPGDSFRSRARAVSNDGTVVVGNSKGLKVPKKGKQSTGHATRFSGTAIRAATHFSTFHRCHALNSRFQRRGSDKGQSVLNLK